MSDGLTFKIEQRSDTECIVWTDGFGVRPASEEESELWAAHSALRKGLQGEVERLRDEAAACRDEAAKRRHKVTADLALGEGSAIDRRADRLAALLDSSGGEK